MPTLLSILPTRYPVGRLANAVGKSFGTSLAVSLLTVRDWFCWLFGMGLANAVGNWFGTLLIIISLTGLGLVWLSWGWLTPLITAC